MVLSYSTHLAEQHKAGFGRLFRGCVGVRFGCVFREAVTFIRTVFRTFDYQETIVHCFLVVDVDLRNDILEQGFFVAGVPSFFRSDADVCARRAAESAYTFAMLVADRPHVFSGTLASPLDCCRIVLGFSTFNR